MKSLSLALLFFLQVNNIYSSFTPDEVEKNSSGALMKKSNHKKPVTKNVANYKRKEKFLDFFNCNICNLQFKKLSNLNRHILTHTYEKTCKICKKNFYSIKEYRKHRRINCSGITFMCDICSEQFFDSLTFKEHKSIDHKAATSKPLKCTICNAGFCFKRNLQKHMEKYHVEGIYYCKDCNIKFKLLLNLITHMENHGGKTPFKCPDCDDEFSESNYFLEHYQIHLHNKFNDPSNFEKSKLTAPKAEIKKPLKCTACNKGFTSENNYKRHTQKFHVIRIYNCKECNVKFRLFLSLITHMRSHGGKTPFKCPECNEEFSESNNLLKHFKNHNIKHKHS